MRSKPTTIIPAIRCYWLLDVKADVPGVDYTDQFELPVFHTSQSQSAFPAVATQRALGRSFWPLHQPLLPAKLTSDVPEPAQHRVVVIDQPDGLEFYFRAGRNVAAPRLVLVLAAGCTALFYAMFHAARRPPIFALVVVGLLAFFLIVASVHSALSSTRIVVGNGLISWRRSVFGIGSQQQFQSSSVESITASTGIQQRSSGTLYSLRLKMKDGKTHAG